MAMSTLTLPYALHPLVTVANSDKLYTTSKYTRANN